jgi:predicted methyltransferase
MSERNPERKIDYFGTFLDSMRSREPAKSDTPPPVQGDVDAVVKALKDGARSAKDLIPLTGNSISAFLAISGQLIDLGWIVRRSSDVFELTAKGREIAEVLD